MDEPYAVQPRSRAKRAATRLPSQEALDTMRLPLFSGNAFGEALGITRLCSHSMLQLFYFSSLFPSSPQ